MNIMSPITRAGDTVTLLLCGGDKRTQAKDVERAKVIANREKQTWAPRTSTSPNTSTAPR